MKFPRPWQLVVGLIATAAVVTASTGTVQAAPEEPAPRFSAVELADAVMFNDGPAAEYLAGWDRPETEWTDATVLSKEAIDEAIANDPEWGAAFASRIQSGDPQRIEGALKDLAEYSRVVADELFGPKVVDRAVEAAGLAGSGTGLYQYRWFYQYLWVYEALAWVIYWAFGLTAHEPGQAAQLDRDLLVREIAVNLAVRG